MIEALFNQPNYLAAKKSLDGVALRQEAIAANLTNLETPGYRRVDLAPAFEHELERACASRNSRQIADLKPGLTFDTKAVPRSRDGNTVNLESELLQLNQNTMAHTLETQFLTGMLLRLKLAISGKPS